MYDTSVYILQSARAEREKRGGLAVATRYDFPRRGENIHSTRIAGDHARYEMSP